MKRPPKFLEISSFYFPVFHLAVCILIYLKTGTVIALAWLVFFPPILCRMLVALYPIKRGASVIGKSTPEGSSWLISHNLQKFYDNLPAIEGLMRLIPGLYSFWLRCWGAKIGKKIQWTSECRIVDRPLLQVGDRCLIGNMSYLTGHAIKKKDGRYFLYSNHISLGNDVVVSYRSTISPGCELGDRSFVEAGASLYPGQKLESGQSYTRSEEMNYVME